MPRTLDLNEMIMPDQLATRIMTEYMRFDMLRNPWLAEKQEIRNYIFATDTGGTTNNVNPWKNSTHVPKLCQLRDNLHANYMAALFPNDRPIEWEGDDESSEAKDKRLAIEAYMENKMRMGGFRNEVSKLVLDYIDYGNCFATVVFVDETTKDEETGEQIQGYVGPKALRLDPKDLVFNPVATDFAHTPKILRSLKTLGSIKADIDDHPEMGYMASVFDDIKAYRHSFQGVSIGDFLKNQAFAIDGFGNFIEYFNSGYVEMLDFYGDIYDVNSGEFQKNRLITIVDRCRIIRNVPNPSWLGDSPIYHAGWRIRPDNLYAMGPLDNLVGMQYRIDHLENAKADAYDLIIHPVIKIKGYVEEFDYGPNARIYMGDDGDVEFERPDTTMLSADTQIAMYENKMEEMAGAPKQAMGFRTPGEKTAYEVQILENGANRVFINKTSYFEEVLIEPLLNAMLESARRNMGVSDIVRVMDDQFGVINFMQITKDDITARGKIRPIGARHFARNANIVQNLTQFASSAIGQDPAVNTHISGKTLAHLMEELLGLERYKLVQDNIRVAEQLETQRLVQSAQQVLGEQHGAQTMPGQPPNGSPPGTPPNAPNVVGPPSKGPPSSSPIPGIGPQQQ